VVLSQLMPPKMFMALALLEVPVALVLLEVLTVLELL
jgi:hypothetical protein